ncbi:MAPEG family protein [Vibrio fluvialis]|uniref:MAPEG family protein n=1 Tax=Vibrio fluvialis TaxID=676 RepID=UPI0005CA145A|nr:MAPEG family protein [Vibrio fluvialis]HDM8033958.1 MAPEG family protein [Vibrio fluvialis clinical-1]EKO3368161.1 MAPEG family protein [Vibrio fluvialis]EKO3380361.1 MAPEG family protein [Vibrio fluvialis]EKO3390073.1 MAPEG family protein [Vibrio fluvialis]EKO3411459.1 MAPEG family protein [Vibrio fluvialis]
MVTALYAVILGGLLIGLAVQVIKQRRRHQVKYMDGGVNALTLARSAQGNAAEYIPITLILMGFAEFNGANVWWLHATGIAFILGRLLHAKAILNDQLKGRITGMKLTFSVMIILMVLNLIYLPYGKLF